MNELINETNRTAKILVVDDEPDMADLMQRKFRHSIHDGIYNFLFAEDGYDALRVLEIEPDIDLVITDINMPRMDGLTLLNHLEEVAPLLKSVIVSAYGDMENIRTAMNRGAFDFVTKPINFSDLEVTIKKTLAEIIVLREAYQQKEKALRERGHLARYFSPAVVDRLVADPSPLSPGVERREMSFVFTDIAGFTPFIEKTDPSTIAPLLNDYFSGMVEIAFRHEGTIDKVVGDGINVFFSAPIAQPDHAARALACALDMDEYTRSFARERRASGVRIGDTRIGVSTGDAVVGNFGCNAFLHYTAYGDVVNTAARLQAANRVLGTHVCVSVSTVAAVPDFTGLPVGELLLKGKSQRVMAYQPVAREDMDSPLTIAYIEAYKLLEDQDDKEPLVKFSAIVDSYPDAH
jgi:adenylate cyclase